MSDLKIVIEPDNEEGFVKGMRDLDENISNLSSLITEIEIEILHLKKTKHDVITHYCNIDQKIAHRIVTRMIVYVPEHMTRSE